MPPRRRIGGRPQQRSALSVASGPWRRRCLLAIALAGVAQAASFGAVALADDERRFAEGLEAYDAGDFATTVGAWLPLAEAGCVEAQVSLADLYLNGFGIPADSSAAARWYRSAAETGDPVAQLNLGDLHARGRGVRRDFREAYFWLDLAARQGNRWAASRRDEIAAFLSAAERTEARERAQQFKPSE